MATTDKESSAAGMDNHPFTSWQQHSEVQTYDNHFFDNMHLQISHEIHGGEQLDSNVDSVIDDHDNTIPYHQYQLQNEVESVPTDPSFVVPSGIFVITILDDLRNADLEEKLTSLKQQLLQHVESNKSLKIKSEKLKADNNALEESYLEELVWLRNTNKDLHKSALGHRNPMYLKSAQLYCPTLYLGDVIGNHVHTPFRVYDSKKTLVQDEVSRTKMLERMKDPLCKVSSKPINYAKLNSLYDTLVPQKQLSREQFYWLPANEVASYNCNQSKLVTNFVRTRPAKSQVNTQLKMLKACFLEFDKVVKDRTTPSYITNGEWCFKHTKKCFVEEIIPFYEKLKTHVKGIEDNLFKEVYEYMKIFDELDKEYDQCVIDKKSLEIENKNLLIQNECLLAESVSKDICFVVLTSDIGVPMSVEPRSNCVEEHSRNLKLEAEILKVCNNSSSPKLNVFFEINKLKDQLQWKDELLRKIKNDSLRDENVSIKKRYQYLYQSKAESNSNVSSRAVVLEKSKVLAPGLYAMTPKYIPYQKRNNREANTPLLRKETVSLVKNTNMCVNLSTGIKSVTEASKLKSKCETKTHRNLPARSEKVTRVDNPLRNLNKRNHVDSSLSVKHIGFTLKSIFVCKTWNECLVFVKVDSESTNGSDKDITNQYEYKQTLDVSTSTPNLSAGLRPNSMAPGHNGAGPEINNLQSGRIGSGLVTTPTTPSVSPIEKKCYYSSNNDYNSLNKKQISESSYQVMMKQALKIKVKVKIATASTEYQGKITRTTS
ncbi:hypothetical protein Tco_1161041 [Tanacetum coccineum]